MSRITGIWLMLKRQKIQRIKIIIIAIGFTIMILSLVYEIAVLNNRVSGMDNKLKTLSDFHDAHKAFIENHKREHESTMKLPVVEGI